MRVYQIVINGGTTALPVRRYAGSEAEARKVRMDLMTEFSMKRSAIEIAPVDIPTSKGDLLVFLNDRKSRPVL